MGLGVKRPPYYLAAMLLAKTVPGGVLADFIAFLCIVVAYHYLYAFLFPQYEFRGHLVRLAALVFVQLIAWPAVFWAMR